MNAPDPKTDAFAVLAETSSKKKKRVVVLYPPQVLRERRFARVDTKLAFVKFIKLIDKSEIVLRVRDLPKSCFSPSTSASWFVFSPASNSLDLNALGCSEPLYREAFYTSALQKAIRRRACETARAAAQALGQISPLALARRLVVIAVEDAFPITHVLSTCVWFMVFFSTKRQHKHTVCVGRALLGILVDGAESLCRVDRVRWAVSVSPSPKTQIDAHQAYETFYASSRRAAYLDVRAAYGGTPWDVDLLTRTAREFSVRGAEDPKRLSACDRRAWKSSKSIGSWPPPNFDALNTKEAFELKSVVSYDAHATKKNHVRLVEALATELGLAKSVVEEDLWNAVFGFNSRKDSSATSKIVVARETNVRRAFWKYVGRTARGIHQTWCEEFSNE